LISPSTTSENLPRNSFFQQATKDLQVIVVKSRGEHTFVLVGTGFGKPCTVELLPFPLFSIKIRCSPDFSIHLIIPWPLKNDDISDTKLWKHLGGF
jgi:hypothetical protein